MSAEKSREPHGSVVDGENSHPATLHEHPHEHDGVVHEHAHHHAVGAPAHVHGHPLALDAFSGLRSPLHRLDPRAKIVAAAILVVTVVLSPPLRAAEAVALAALLLAVTAIGELPLRWILLRSAVVLPIAGTIALFAPLARHGSSFSPDALGETYARGWIVGWGILSKAWVSAYATLLVSASTPPAKLFQALRRLKMPAVFVTMLVFLYRFGAVLGKQLASLRRAVASRGFATRGRRLVSLYGNLAGNLFVRSYERGERVYAAMLSRGFNGILPSPEPLRLKVADALAVLLIALAAASTALY